MPSIRTFLEWLSLRKAEDETAEEVMAARERILEELRSHEPMFYVNTHGQSYAPPGLFSRIARDLGVSPGYVSRVAHSINLKGGAGRPRKAA